MLEDTLLEKDPCPLRYVVQIHFFQYVICLHTYRVFLYCTETLKFYVVNYINISAYSFDFWVTCLKSA